MSGSWPRSCLAASQTAFALFLLQLLQCDASGPFCYENHHHCVQHHDYQHDQFFMRTLLCSQAQQLTKTPGISPPLDIALFAPSRSWWIISVKYWKFRDGDNDYACKYVRGWKIIRPVPSVQNWILVVKDMFYAGSQYSSPFLSLFQIIQTELSIPSLCQLVVSCSESKAFAQSCWCTFHFCKVINTDFFGLQL